LISEEVLLKIAFFCEDLACYGLTWKLDVQQYVETHPPSENMQVHIYLVCGELILCGCPLKKYIICIEGLCTLFHGW
jgi:hypothetical protein